MCHQVIITLTCKRAGCDNIVGSFPDFDDNESRGECDIVDAEGEEHEITTTKKTEKGDEFCESCRARAAARKLSQEFVPKPRRDKDQDRKDKERRDSHQSGK